MSKRMNPEILNSIKKSTTQVSEKDLLGYLLCLENRIYPSYIPTEIEELAKELGLVDTKEEKPILTTPLYSVGSDKYWEWVGEKYLPLFAEIGKGNPLREVVARMKKLFTENPQIRADEVIEATKYYLKSTDSRYTREARYFIYKGVGINKTYDLLHWIEKYKKEVLPTIEERDLSRTLQ